MAHLTRGWAIPIDATEFVARIKAYHINRQVIDSLYDEKKPLFCKLSRELLDKIVQDFLELEYRRLLPHSQKSGKCFQSACYAHEDAHLNPRLGTLPHLPSIKQRSFEKLQSIWYDWQDGHAPHLDQRFADALHKQMETIFQEDLGRHQKILQKCARNLEAFQEDLKSFETYNIQPVIQLLSCTPAEADPHSTYPDADLTCVGRSCHNLHVYAFLFMPIEDAEFDRLSNLLHKDNQRDRLWRSDRRVVDLLRSDDRLIALLALDDRLQENHDLLMPTEQKTALLKAARVLNLTTSSHLKPTYHRGWGNWLEYPIDSDDQGEQYDGAADDRGRCFIPWCIKDFDRRPWLANLRLPAPLRPGGGSKEDDNRVDESLLESLAI
ncbi:uncharacterized protein KY384_003979 [Bacidia gigantensis]|uniref:uncharacterized protein n=1 Tax=Bacidia gigantensis TaxID=2732470 RepID=UPI001D038167|nr:uncharacterized protein KY384_003979 [Bacidia gigantensis]KAG8532338.1 hypothetical protein KY384_003979 [Bacidia gigantensis]